MEGSKHVNEKQLEALAETEASQLEGRGRSHAMQNLQDSQPGAAKKLSDLERRQGE